MLTDEIKALGRNYLRNVINYMVQEYDNLSGQAAKGGAAQKAPTSEGSKTDEPSLGGVNSKKTIQASMAKVEKLKFRLGQVASKQQCNS